MKSPLLTALAVAFALGITAISSHAQDIAVTHAQGETVLTGVPEKVLVQDWATFDNLAALGVTVAGVPSSNVPHLSLIHI